jgi:hypothetical protein
MISDHQTSDLFDRCTSDEILGGIIALSDNLIFSELLNDVSAYSLEARDS